MSLELRGAGVRAGDRWILRGFDLRLAPGRVVAVVGESGCGKSTLARALAGLEPLAEGARCVDGRPVSLDTPAERLAYARQVHLVLQDASGALDPLLTVERSVAEPLELRGLPRAEVRARVAEALARVALPAELAARRPAALSAGQRQRVGLARGLVGAPRWLLLDEPVSALDAAVQAQLVALLRDLQATLGFGMVLVTHELGVAQALAHDVAVLFGGRLVEEGPAAAVLAAPRHPATQALVAAARAPGLRAVAPEPPRWDAPGCRFAPRCPRAQPRCVEAAPALTQGLACWVPEAPP